MKSKDEQSTGQQHYILILLLVVCVGPVAGSWLLVNFTDMGERRGQVNHGALIQPPRPLPNLTLFDPALGTDSATLHGKWSLVYLLGGSCNQDCEQNLYKMRQLELATGKHSHRVQRVLFSYGGDKAALSAERIRPYERQLIAAVGRGEPNVAHFALSVGDLPLQAGRLYVVDPLGNLMMSYEQGAEPSGIIRDLKRLLKYSKVG